MIKIGKYKYQSGKQHDVYLQHGRIVSVIARPGDFNPSKEVYDVIIEDNFGGRVEASSMFEDVVNAYQVGVPVIIGLIAHPVHGMMLADPACMASSHIVQ